MSWHEQTKSMMETWMNAQRQMIDGWSSMTQAATSSTPNAMPNMEIYTRIVDFWRETMAQTSRTWLQAADPTAQDVAQKMFASQGSMMKLLQMSMQVWDNLMPAMQNGGNWRESLNHQMEKVRAELLQNATDLLNSNKNMMQLWQTYVDQSGGFFAPWFKAMQGSMGSMGSLAGGDSHALVEMTGLYWDAFQESFGKMLQAPGLGYTREMDEKVRIAFASWVDYREASYEYQVVLADTWSLAFAALLKDAVEMTQRGETINSVREFLDYWSTTADRVFKEVFRSERYIRAQGNMVNAMMRYRRHQRTVNEMAMNMMDVPTRSEVDEAHRRVYELRKEVKALRKELKELRQMIKPNDDATPAKKTTTRKKSTAKSASSGTGED